MRFCAVTEFGKKKDSILHNTEGFIREQGCALLKGCEPQRPKHVYLAAPQTLWNWPSSVI